MRVAGQPPLLVPETIEFSNKSSPVTIRLKLLHLINDTSVTGSSWLDRVFYTLGLNYKTGTEVIETVHIHGVEVVRSAYLQDKLSRKQTFQPDLIFEVAPQITIMRVHTGSFLDMIAKIGGMIALAIILSIILGFFNQHLFERNLSKQLKQLKKKVHHDEDQPSDLDEGFDENDESEQKLKVNLRQYFSFQTFVDTVERVQRLEREANHRDERIEKLKKELRE